MIKPLYGLIVVKQIDVDNSVSTLILPQNLEDKKRYGVVIDKGHLVIPQINIGDKVMWAEETGEAFYDNDEEYIIMQSEKLKAVV